MRVITGSAKGYGLKTPRHLNLRPTPARVKEAIFSSLAARVPDARVLDLFAGTGAFAIETLSRGAASATLVEKDRRAVALIESNLRKTLLAPRARVIGTDVRQALDWLARGTVVFDLIFADPPYVKGERPAPDAAPVRSPSRPLRAPFSWTSFLLESPVLRRLLASGGLLLLERFRKEILPPHPLYRLQREFTFGDTMVAVFEANLHFSP